MYLTRRGWEAVGIAGVFGGVAVLARQPLALYAALVVAAVVLTRQVAAVRSFIEAADEISVTYETDRESSVVSEDLQLTLTIATATPRPEEIEVTAPLPAGATGGDSDSRTVRMPPGETTASTTFRCSFPVAGRFTFPAPTLSIEDRPAWFAERFDWTGQARQAPPTVTIEPRTPRQVHVGQGGEEVAVYGEHETGAHGAGITPAELRQYVPGDPRRRIDWKATARLGEPHVREFEAETDRQTVLVLDHRASMNVGSAGETMLAYAREVALGLATVAEQNGDPLCLYTVGDAGLTESTQPTTSPQGYTQVRTTLHDCVASGGSTPRRDGNARAVADGAGSRAAQTRRLAGDESAFARTLSPFLRATAVEQRMTEAPLRSTVERLRAELSGQRWTVLLTSDADPTQVRQAVDAARGENDYVSVFLTPRVLFETGGLADLERAYERYVEFETFRRELARRERVTAFEVGPGDRLHALLEERRD